jgi:glyoxalase family protein
MSQPITAGFHHVTLVSSDAERSLAFYRDLLGFHLIGESEGSGEAPFRRLYLGDAGGTPGFLLALFLWPSAERGHWGPGGIHHVAIGTRDRETQLMWKRRLNDAGIPVGGPYDRGYFHSIYFQDPDGQILEIATAGPGYDFDEPIESLGSAFIRPQDQRLHGRRNEIAIHRTSHPDPVPTITEEMTIQGIHHVTGITDDTAEADRFYREALGLRLVKNTVNQDDESSPHLFWANYDGTRVLPHSSMTLFGWPPGARAARPGVGQTHHIAFRAKDDDELQLWQDRIAYLGIVVSEIRDQGLFRSIRFAAPDGLQIEMASDRIATD